MINMEQCVMINRAVDEVWRFMSNVENIPEWEQGLLEGRQTSERLMGFGSTVQTIRQFLGRRWIDSLHGSEHVPNRTMAFQADAKLISAKTLYIFEAVEGWTRLTQTTKLELRGWWKLVTAIVVPILKRDGREDFANLKRILEAPG